MKKRLLCLLLMLTLLLTLCPAAYAAPDDLRFSDSLVAFIKEGEGFRAEPYGGPGGWYIGYGCACDPADYPYPITEAEAEALLRSKMESFANSVRSFLKKYGASVTQSQFDAMCAMSYALGPAWLNPGNRLPSYIINGISNYTLKKLHRVIFIGRIPDHTDDIKTSKDIPSWKRMCFCILKNDHTCRFMGFGLSREQQKRVDILKRKYSKVGE